MCITFFYINTHKNKKWKKNVKFFIGFNRDQDANRQTLPFGVFQDDRNIYAGRDVLTGGSWLGINVATGIMVILTNYKLIKPRVAKSRGLLVRYFLNTSYLNQLPKDYTPADVSTKIKSDMQKILSNHKQYSAFNISVYNIKDNKIFYMCSETAMKEPILLETDKVHGYSNTDINSNWFKVAYGKKMFQKIVVRLRQMESDEGISDENKQQKQIKQQKIDNKQQSKHTISQHQPHQTTQIKSQSSPISQTIEQLFKLMQQTMQNKQGTNWFWKYFQTSIFINPYYDPIYRRCSMTKSTFYAVFTEDQDGHIQVFVKQVSYMRNGGENVVKMMVQIQ